MNSGLGFAALVAGVVSRWRTVLGVMVATVALACGLALVLPPSYRSSASFVTADADVQLPPSLDNLAGGSALGGVARELGLGTTGDPSRSPAFYYQLLRSRELLTRLLLSRLPDPRNLDAADSVTLLELTAGRSGDRERALEVGVKRLRRTMRVGFDQKTSLVDLDVRARWPTLSADIANRAVALVSAFNKEQRLSRAQARRAFLEGRLAATQDELRAAENALRAFYENNRLWRDAPGLAVEERRLRRQVEMVGDLYLSLRREYEAARLDEVNTTPVITVVDRAVPPRRRYWPRWGMILFTATALGVGMGLLWTAGREVAAHWAAQNPEEARRLEGAVARASREATGLLRRPRRAEAARDVPT